MILEFLYKYKFSQTIANFCRFIIYLFCILCCLFALEAKALDAEIRESKKCSLLFRNFEKVLKIPRNTLYSIALKESGKKHTKRDIVIVWPWTVNVAGQGHYFKTKDEAIKFVKKKILAGFENIDVGCMQINLKHHINAFDSLEQAFDPQHNIAYGAKFLRDKYQQFGSWHAAIANYHSAVYERGYKYKNDVIKIANRIDRNRVDDKYSVYSSLGLQNSFVKKKNLLFNSKKYKSNLMLQIYASKT